MPQQVVEPLARPGVQQLDSAAHVVDRGSIARQQCSAGVLPERRDELDGLAAADDGGLVLDVQRNALLAEDGAVKVVEVATLLGLLTTLLRLVAPLLRARLFAAFLRLVAALLGAR